MAFPLLGHWDISHTPVEHIRRRKPGSIRVIPNATHLSLSRETGRMGTPSRRSLLGWRQILVAVAAAIPSPPSHADDGTNLLYCPEACNVVCWLDPHRQWRLNLGVSQTLGHKQCLRSTIMKSMSKQPRTTTSPACPVAPITVTGSK